jgi:hypothetical protein
VRSTLIAAGCALAVLLSAPAPSAQLADLQPGRNFTAAPSFGTGYSQQLDGGDADLDGDFDVVVGNGGVGPAQLSRIYINGGFGTFTDETATRFAGFPMMNARDIEFFDTESDGDLDVFVGDHTKGSSSPGAVSRCFVNLGGAQHGQTGFFQEDTEHFWGALVSVPDGQQLCGGCDEGPFRDFACDCEFDDLDDDGHLDLFFGTYGPGTVPGRDSRVFLNDGVGAFHEQWPWTDPATDTSWVSPDVELADLDGDFDIDLVVAGAFIGGSHRTRIFVNNLHQPLGTQPFSEITQHALIDSGAAPLSVGNYEVELADTDGDGDFDLWLDNQAGLTDRLLRNDGPDAGGLAFTRMDSWIKSDPGQDEEEADFADYDNDGDFDLFLANISGFSLLYQSGLAQGLDSQAQGLYHRTGFASGLAPLPELPPSPGLISQDGEWLDVDADGDLDILVARDLNAGNSLFRNALGVPDTHAPSFEAVTVQSDKPNGTDSVIHAAARDNAPLQLHRYYGAALVYSVDGGAPRSTPMLAQGGQQYRGVIPAQTDATIEYHVEVTDLAGNTGVSAAHAFTQGGDGPWTDLGSGLAGVVGVPTLTGTGTLNAGSPGALTLANSASSAVCALFVSIASAPAPFKCGTLVPVPVAIQLTLVTNGSGGLPLAWGSWPSGLSGASLYFQYAIADVAAVCGTSLSNAIKGDVP